MEIIKNRIALSRKKFHNNLLLMVQFSRLIYKAFQRGGKYPYRDLKEEYLERNNFLPSPVRFLDDVVFAP